MVNQHIGNHGLGIFGCFDVFKFDLARLPLNKNQFKESVPLK